MTSERLTPALKLDAGWIDLLDTGTLTGLFAGIPPSDYISDKVRRRKTLLIDITVIDMILVAMMFASSFVKLLAMRVLIGIVISTDYPTATSMITKFPSTR